MASESLSSPSDWLRASRCKDDLRIALEHVNDARSNMPSEDRLQACDHYFKALNRLWGAALRAEQDGAGGHIDAGGSGDSAAFARLLKTLGAPEQQWLLGRPSVQHLASFEPPILDHSQKGMLHPGHEIPEGVRDKASQQHREFANKWRQWRASGSQQVAVLRSLARVLYVVRSNLAHGEKTVHGPDFQRADRNRSVARVVMPVVEDVIDAVLGHPSHRLIAYGTIRPGQPNHALVASLAGSWIQVLIPGVLREEDGLPSFRWTLRGSWVEAHLLESPSLPDELERLDDFEGPAYARRLAIYRVDGVCGVGNLYETREH